MYRVTQCRNSREWEIVVLFLSSFCKLGFHPIVHTVSTTICAYTHMYLYASFMYYVPMYVVCTMLPTGVNDVHAQSKQHCSECRMCCIQYSHRYICRRASKDEVNSHRTTWGRKN